MERGAAMGRGSHGEGRRREGEVAATRGKEGARGAARVLGEGGASPPYGRPAHGPLGLGPSPGCPPFAENPFPSPI